MAVLIPNVELRIRKRTRPSGRDDHGQPLPSVLGVASEPFPCGVKNRPERNGWSLRMDPRMWPCEAGDEVSDGSRVWILTGEPQLHAVPGIDAVDHVTAIGTLTPPEVP